jgi:prepilin-type N-terminal cleavage/methylation domain-containing protein
MTSTRARRGFTIVELLVAIMIFSVGVLALAGTSARIVEMSASSLRSVRAAAIANSRFEQLRSLSCVNLSDSKYAYESRGISESWAVTLTPYEKPRTADVTLFIQISQRGGERTVQFRDVFPC